MRFSGKLLSWTETYVHLLFAWTCSAVFAGRDPRTRQFASWISLVCGLPQPASVSSKPTEGLCSIPGGLSLSRNVSWLVLHKDSPRRIADSAGLEMFQRTYRSLSRSPQSFADCRESLSESSVNSELLRRQIRKAFLMGAFPRGELRPKPQASVSHDPRADSCRRKTLKQRTSIDENHTAKSTGGKSHDEVHMMKFT